jgi:carboxymethylenebutenolidase
MQTTTVDVPTAEGVADAYLITRGDGGSHPAVLMFMDAFGLRPRLSEMAERIASHGYVVLLPNLFYRTGRAPLFDMSELQDPEQRSRIFARIAPLMAALKPEVIARDTGAYLDFLAGRDEVAAGGVAVTGYCMGGANALRAAAAFPDRIAAVASFHGGRLATDAADSPHLCAGRITGEVYLAHADQDPSMPGEQIKVLEAALDEAGTTYTSEVYAGAAHGFTMADTAAYDAAAEERHWTNLIALLSRTLKP